MTISMRSNSCLSYSFCQVLDILALRPSSESASCHFLLFLLGHTDLFILLLFFAFCSKKEEKGSADQWPPEMASVPKHQERDKKIRQTGDAAAHCH